MTEVEEIETIEEPINKIISNDETVSEPVTTKTEVKESPR